MQHQILIQKVLLALICFTNFASVATVNVGPQRAPIANWSGFFIGAQGGYNWTKMAWMFPYEEYYNNNPGDQFTTHPRGGNVGAYLGLNHQINTIVLGMEAAVNVASSKKERVGPITTDYPYDLLGTRVDKIGTLSASLGFAQNLWLLYIKGGIAAAPVTLNAVSGEPGPGVISKKDTTQKGWTASGGLEYMFIPGFSLGLQYDYIKLDDKLFTTTTKGEVVGDPFHVNLKDVNINSITARLSIKLI